MTTTSKTIPSADNLASISAYIQEAFPTKQAHRGLATAFDFLLFKRHVEVVDFWSQLFLGSETNHTTFTTLVVKRLQALGYIPKRENGMDSISFSEGIVGPCRDMVTANAGRSRTTVFFASVGDFLYVSLRAIYRPAFSFLRVGWHLLLIGLLALLFGILATEDYCSSQYSYYSYPSNGYSVSGYAVGCTDSEYQDHAIEQFGQACVALAIGLTLTRMGISFWRTCNLWTWLYEDFNELYRDDVSLLGSLTHLCIVSVADELDLQQVQVSEVEPPPPQFGGWTQSNPSRKRRI
ncbi:MAG: hypothetical protein K8L91_27155 [Anaerolineae bacterium]|nr:hypothetical protein [Anaerolineae bacterium]